MTARLARVTIVLLVVVGGGPAAVAAQTMEVAPFVGYRFGGGFFERITNQPVDLDGAPAVGGVVNVEMHDGLWFEGLFTHQEALVDVPGGLLSPPARWRITVDQWFAGGLQEFGTNPAIRPFATGLLGLTRYAADTDSELRFAVGAGGGVKLRPTRHVAVRLDGRVFTTFADFDARAGVCTTGRCALAFAADVVWQAEFTAGLSIMF